MKLLYTKFKFFGSCMYMKFANNFYWAPKLLPSKNEICSHKGSERVYLIEWA